MATIQLDIGGNTSRLDKDIQKTVNKVYTINLKTKGDQPLGRITGQVNEFNKSLDASNARVIAFGASAGIIFGIERAFSALVASTIEVQKSLQDINVILNVSTQELNKFGGELFNIAKNTGQSFDEVAKAATEFSRQGLGVTETLKRTNDALVLSRLSGLDAAKSVDALTAAVNSFASQAVTASEIVNKFANVDAAFAVSSADLADAISRVGSSAAQSGVQLDELIAIVTAAQQTTARGGAVIGNSFKTIFTRLQRGKVIDLLESLGISSTDSSGQLKSTIQLLQDLGRVYDTLGAQQQSYVAEQVGGVFQINILKAALADLGKEYSIYNNALGVSASSTDQAYVRNEQLNKTYAAQINILKQNATQLASMAGERLLGPAFERVVGGANTLLGGINESDGTGVGAALGKGILDGLGQFIAGPGLAILGGVLIKLFKDLGKFTTGSLKQLLGLNTAATQQQNLQQSINQILSKNPQLLELALKGEQGLNAAANQLLANLQKQTVELQKQAIVASQISKAFYGAGVRVTGGVPTAPTKAGKAAGFIPNFASDRQIEKAQAMALGATSSVRAHMSQGTIGGRKFMMNNQETEFPGVGRNGDSMVIPKYAKGFVPNFQKNLPTPKEILVSGAKKYGYLIPSTAPGRLSTPDKPIPGGTITDPTNNIKYVFPPQTAYGPKLIGEAESSNKLENQIYQSVLNRTASYTKKLAPPGKPISASDLEKGFQSAKGAKGAILSAIGAAFEVGITTALGYEAIKGNIGSGDFDVRSGKGIEKVQSLFGIGGLTKADFKATTGGDSVSSFRKKILREEFGFGMAKKRTGPTGKELKQLGLTSGFKRKAFAGFIPNFSSTNRGVPVSQIRAHFDKNGNPMAVTNTRDEPNGLKDAIGRERKGIGMYANGFVPNFADDTTGIGSGVAAVGIELIGLSYMLSGTTQQYKNSIKEIADANKGAVPKMKKFGAAADAYGSAIAIGAPIITATIKNMIPQESYVGRTAAAATTGVGQALSMGATAAQLGLAFGPKGAAVGAGLGAVAGALMSVPDVINAFTSTVPDATAAYEKANQSLTKFNDSALKLTGASESLKNALSEAVPSPKKVKQAQDEYAQALSEFSPDEQTKITTATNQDTELEKLRKQKDREAANAKSSLALSQLYDTTGFTGGKAIFSTSQGSSQQKLQGQANRDIVQKGFIDTLLQGKTGKEALPTLEDLTQRDVSGQLSRLAVSGKDLETQGIPELEKILKDLGMPADYTAKALELAGSSMVNFIGFTGTLGKALADTTSNITSSTKSADDFAKSKSDEAKATRSAIQNTENYIKYIEKMTSSLDTKSVAARQDRETKRSLSRESNLADKFTRPAETVKELVGSEAPLAQKFQSRVDVAQINKTFQDGVDKITFGIANNISTEFTKSLAGLTTSKIENISGIEGATSKDINTARYNAETEFNKQFPAFKDLQNIISSNIEGQGKLDLQTLESKLSEKLSKIGIIGDAQKEIMSKVRDNINSGNNELAKLKSEAQQSRLTLAKETTQKILIAKIGQAQKFAGGIGEYLNPQKAGESTFDKAIQATKGLDKFQGQKNDFAFDYRKGSNQFRYQYPQSEAARKKQAPEYGRASLNLIGGLQDYFGYTPDASGKAYQAGVTGLKENLDQQVAEFQKIASNPQTPDMVRDEINSALKEVRALGGTGNIAAVQVAKETGSLTEQGLQKITGKFSDPVLETLRQQNPELASMKAAEMIVSDDPTVKAINKTNSILIDIKNAYTGGTENGVTTLNAQGNPVGLTGGPQQVAKDREKTTSATQSNTASNEGLTTVIQSLQGVIQTFNNSINASNTTANPGGKGGNLASQTQGGNQSSNIGPFNVVVNGSQGDISSQLNSALEKLKSEILSLVNVKVPPTVPSSQAAPKTSSTP